MLDQDHCDRSLYPYLKKERANRFAEPTWEAHTDLSCCAKVQA